jgi:hypothetical protein
MYRDVSWDTKIKLGKKVEHCLILAATVFLLYLFPNFAYWRMESESGARCRLRN